MSAAEQQAQTQLDFCKLLLHCALNGARGADRHFRDLERQGDARPLPSAQDCELGALRLAVQGMVDSGMTGELIAFAIGEYSAQHPEWKPFFTACEVIVDGGGRVTIQPALPLQ